MQSDKEKKSLPAETDSVVEGANNLSKIDAAELKQRYKQLRAKADELLYLEILHPPSPLTQSQLQHELRVHQIELEMQIEQLRQMQLALEVSRDRYVDLFELSPVGYLTLTHEGMISEVNLKTTAMLRVARDKLIRRLFSQFVADQDKDNWHRALMSMNKAGGSDACNMDMCLKRKDGSLFFAQINALRMTALEANDGLQIAIIDITERKTAEGDLRIAAIAFESQEGMLITDVDGTILRVNQAFTNITGYTAAEAVGQNPRMLSSGRQDAAFYAVMWESIHSTGAWQGEIWNRRKNGNIYPEHLLITAVKDSNGVVTNYVAALTDITVSKAASDEIKHLAFFDPLTSLPNRRFLLDRLKQALASSSRTGNKGALLFIDLDDFKTLNDTLGHDIGDLLLQQVARRLESCVRDGDSVARLGGDEFVVMLEDLNEKSIEAATQTKVVGEKILATLNQPYQLGKHECRSTPSIGAALFAGQQTIDELLKQADIAMYQAKATGRNTLRFFDVQMQANITARASMETDLRLALERNQFRLYFQLQANHNRQIVGAEVLIRWQHPERGLVLPLDFIPLAEETGMILPIGLWVLETACAQLKSWEGNSFTQHLQLAVNVSAIQFHQADFVEQVCQVIRQTAIKPDRLKLELTESLVLDDINDTISKINALSEVGVHFSMDDFGTGYSSLSNLKKLPIHQLKIDQSFVRDIATDSDDAAIVQTIIAMAINLGLEVIAEGVETEEQVTFLQQHGCLAYQGYLFSKPVPLEEFEALLKKV